MTRAAERVTPSIPPRVAVPPLRNGDNLTEAEFEERCEAMPPGSRAELIEGIVYVFPPVSHGWHGRPHASLVGLFVTYWAETPGVTGGDNSTLRLDLGNLPQPDAYLMVEPACGGQVTLDDDLNIIGAPELVAEVAATSANYDLHQKLEVYRRNRVGEYLVWRTFDRRFDHFALRKGRFRAVAIPADGILRSERFPGLWINTAALIGGDLSSALSDVRRGVASPEHAAFVADLRRRRSTGRVVGG